MADQRTVERVEKLETRMDSAEFTIREVGENTRHSLDGMRSEIGGLRQEMYKALDDMRQEMYRALGDMDKSIDTLRKDTKDGLNDLKGGLRDTRNLMFGLFGVLALLMTLYKFL